MVYKPADLAKVSGYHKTSILRIADEIGITPARRGVLNERRFTKRQAKRLLAELERRRNPAAALKGDRG